MWKSVTRFGYDPTKMSEAWNPQSSRMDESVIPYCGKYRPKLKQRMPLKPIRSSYKVWCLNLEGGYIYNFEIYQVKGSKNEFSNQFGLGSSLVLGLIKSLPPRNFSVFSDSYFDLIPLLKHMKTKVRLHWPSNPNMWQDFPLPSKKWLHKKIKTVICRILQFFNWDWTCPMEWKCSSYDGMKLRKYWVSRCWKALVEKLHPIINTWVGQIKWIRVFQLTHQQCETESGIGFYSHAV